MHAWQLLYGPSPPPDASSCSMACSRDKDRSSDGPNMQPLCACEPHADADRGFLAGYQWYVVAGFILALPLSILLQTYRTVAITLVCRIGALCSIVKTPCHVRQLQAQLQDQHQILDSVPGTRSVHLYSPQHILLGEVCQNCSAVAGCIANCKHSVAVCNSPASIAQVRLPVRRPRPCLTSKRILDTPGPHCGRSGRSWLPSRPRSSAWRSCSASGCWDCRCIRPWSLWLP